MEANNFGKYVEKYHAPPLWGLTGSAKTLLIYQRFIENRKVGIWKRKRKWNKKNC